MANELKIECRACSHECGDYMRLQEIITFNDKCSTIAAMFTYCTTLECFVGNGDIGMPEHICKSCVEHLIQSYMFKEMALLNDTAFRERIKVKQEQQNSIKTSKVNTGFYHEREEIEVGGINENLKFIVKMEENVEGASAGTEFKKDCFELVEVSESAIDHNVAHDEMEVDKNINSATEENILPDSIPETYIKIENCDENNFKNELPEGDRLLINTPNEEFENNGNFGEASQEFEDKGDKETDSHKPQEEVETIEEESELRTKAIKRTSLQSIQLTKLPECIIKMEVNCPNVNIENSSEVDDLFNLLSLWNLECLYETLKDQEVFIPVLKVVKLEQIPTFLKEVPAGKAILFEHCLEQWRKSLDLQNVNNKNSKLFDSSSSSHKCENKNTVELQTILKKSKNGKLLLEFYNKNNCFKEEQRNLLINLIGNYIYENNLTFTLQQSYDMENEIVQKFPSEKIEFYRTTKKGRLYTKLANLKYAPKRHGLFDVRESGNMNKPKKQFSGLPLQTDT